MTFKVIQVATPEDRAEAIRSIAAEWPVTDIQVGSNLEDGRRFISLLVGDTDRQALVDRLQNALGNSGDWRIALLPADTVIGRQADSSAPEVEIDEEKKREEQARASREELHNLVATGARTDRDFLLLVFLSTVVASLGLEQDSVAVLIGAMVIAPLLGPHVAFAFGAAIGDRKLMWSAAVSATTGIICSVAIAGALARVIPVNTASHELMTRTTLDFAGIALGLASGAAAALSVTTGLSSTLVGVMVAVALLPPAATVGIMITAGRPSLAAGAAMLLVANVACVNLAAQLIFLVKGIKPRRWAEQQSARKAVAVNVITWVALILVLGGVIALRQSAQ